MKVSIILKCLEKIWKYENDWTFLIPNLKSENPKLRKNLKIWQISNILKKSKICKYENFGTKSQNRNPILLCFKIENSIFFHWENKIGRYLGEIIFRSLLHIHFYILWFCPTPFHTPNFHPQHPRHPQHLPFFVHFRCSYFQILYFHGFGFLYFHFFNCQILRSHISDLPWNYHISFIFLLHIRFWNIFRDISVNFILFFETFLFVWFVFELRILSHNYHLKNVFII